MRTPSRRPSPSKPAAIARQEWMALAGERHVERARQAHAHRTPGLPGAERRDRRPRIRLHFLAAERAAHAQAFHRHLIAARCPARAPRSPAFPRDAASRSAAATPPDLVEPRDGALRLQIEMLLPADREARPSNVRARLFDAAGSPRGMRSRTAVKAPPRWRLRWSGSPAAVRTRPRTARPRRGAQLPASRPAPTPPAAGETSLRTGNSGSSWRADRCRLRRAHPPASVPSPRRAPTSAGEAIQARHQACACGASTGQACSRPGKRPSRSSV